MSSTQGSFYHERLLHIHFAPSESSSVGLTEAAARADGRAVRTSTIGLEQVPRALVARDTRGLIKLMADAQSNQLLGAHILAPEGADSIQTAAIAIRQRSKFPNWLKQSFHT